MSNKKINFLILISKTTNEMHKKLSPLNEHNNNPNFCEIFSQIFKKIIDMGLGVKISLDQFFLGFQLNEKTYLLDLPCIV
jgi:hypothetical protein